MEGGEEEEEGEDAGDDDQDVRDFFGELLYRAYELCPELRRTLRSSMGLVLKRMAAATSSSSSSAAASSIAAARAGARHRNLALGTCRVLRVIAAIIRGFSLGKAGSASSSSSSVSPRSKQDPTAAAAAAAAAAASRLSSSHRALLLELLLPLHAVPGKVSHSEPALSLIYHPLVECLVEFVRHDPAWALPTILRRILMYWPHASAGNSPKEILMVQELSTLLELAHQQNENGGNDNDDAGGKTPSASSTSSTSSTSSSASTSHLLQAPERRLLFARIAACLSSENSLVCQAALRLWSVPDVTRFFRRYWGEVLGECWGPLSVSAARHWNATCKRQTGVVVGIILQDVVLQSESAGASGAVPWLPRGVTRETLEAMCARLAPPSPADGRRQPKRQKTAAAAAKCDGLSDDENDRSNDARDRGGGGSDGGGGSGGGDSAGTKTDRGEGKNGDADRRPHLVHSNFVFGEALGSGSFATVKHVWLIVRGKPRSAWPEYAVKSVDRKFETVALREAKVMEQLAGLVPLADTEEGEEGKDDLGGGGSDHDAGDAISPRRARSQRWGSLHRHLTRLACPIFKSRRGTLHLVMDYAHFGDLHSQVVQSSRRQDSGGGGGGGGGGGSFTSRKRPSSRRRGLGEATTALVTAEILSALSHIHKCGFVFSDLKPENVLVMRDGHIKLCDFGATRTLEECKRGAPLEGTAMYMAPEVLSSKQSQVTVSADLWSLGCLVHFALSGRPPAGLGPSLDLDQVAAKVIKWGATSTASSGGGGGKSNTSFSDASDQHLQHVGGDFPLHFSPAVRSLVSGLLTLDPDGRTDVARASAHPFLAEHGFGSAADVAAAAQSPVPEGTWQKLDAKAKLGGGGGGRDFARRSFSLIVAPLPGRFRQRGAGADGDRVDGGVLCEEEGERELPWLPDPSRLLKPRLMSIHEEVASGAGDGRGGSGSSGGGAGKYDHHHHHHQQQQWQQYPGTSSRVGGGRHGSKSSAAPMSLTGFPGRGSLRTTMPGSAGPIRAGMHFPPRANRMLPPRGGRGGRRGPFGGRGSAAGVGGGNRRSNDPRARLFVKGLDLTAG